MSFHPWKLKKKEYIFLGDWIDRLWSNDEFYRFFTDFLIINILWIKFKIHWNFIYNFIIECCQQQPLFHSCYSIHFKCFVNRGAIRIRINLHFIYFHFTRIFSFPFHASISFFRFVGNDRRWIFTGSFFFLTSLLLSVHRFLANLPDFASFTITGWNNFNFIFFFFFFFQRTNRPVYQSLGSRRAGDKWRRGRVVLKKERKKKGKNSVIHRSI